MKPVESPLLPGEQGPGFAAVQKVLTTHALYTCTIVRSVSLPFVQTLFFSLESVVAAFPRRLLSSGSKGETVGDR